MNADATPVGRNHLSLAVLLFILSLGVAQALYFRAELPTRVASHFDGAGRPNGWMSRDGFVLFQCVMLLSLGALFGLAGSWLAVVPNWMVNLPNKNYWLAPERRAQSVAHLAVWMRWFGAATLGFLIVVFQFTVKANLRNGRLDTPQFLVVLGIFLVGITIAAVMLHRRFRIPTAAR